MYVFDTRKKSAKIKKICQKLKNPPKGKPETTQILIQHPPRWKNKLCYIVAILLIYVCHIKLIDKVR